jgi:hypothetical protein
MVWTLIKRRHLSGLLGTSYESKALKGSARGLKVVIIEWDCVAFVPAESLLAKGYTWDEAREVWLGQTDIESGIRFAVKLVLSDCPVPLGSPKKGEPAKARQSSVSSQLQLSETSFQPAHQGPFGCRHANALQRNRGELSPDVEILIAHFEQKDLWHDPIA